METTEGLKQRRAWLLKQVELTDRALEKLLQKAHAPRPTPQDLPGVPPAPPKPPRQLSVHEENHQEFQNARRARFQSLGIDFVADEVNTPAFVVVTMKRLRDACSDDDELFALFDAYLSLPWPANPPRGLPPGAAFSPYSFRTMASANTWRPLLDELHAAKPRAAGS